MIKTEFRDMNQEERAKLLEALRKAKPHFPFELTSPPHVVGLIFLLLLFSFVGFLTGTFAITILYFLSKAVPALAFLSKPAAVQLFQKGGALLGAVGIPLLLLFAMRKASRRHCELLQQDLSEGRVELIHVTAEAAVRRTVDDDEKLFFIDAGDSKMIFLCGEHLTKPLRIRKFPNTEFEFMRAPNSRHIIHLDCLGKPFEVEEQLFEMDLDNLSLADGDVFEGSLQTLAQDLKKLTLKSRK